jgi:3-phenylpropionate/cinnamic acid dioxygenase small subunit
MSHSLARNAAEDLLYREAMLLDNQDWDGWLALYLGDAQFWAPAWRDETTPTKDPTSELSLIYYQGKRNLEDRVWRVRSGLSVASHPLPRTAHMIGNVCVTDQNEGLVSSTFTVNLFDKRANRSHAFFGRYQHHLRFVDGQWRIAAKTIWLLNDTIPTVVDFYSL